jgi:hypothetical protein
MPPTGEGILQELCPLNAVDPEATLLGELLLAHTGEELESLSIA